MTLRLPNEDDGPIGGDETSMRPLLDSTNVTGDMSQPLILLQVKGTDLYANGLYDHDNDTLDAVGIFVGDEATQPRFAPGLTAPVTYVAVPTIVGVAGVEFRNNSTDMDSAQRAS